MKKILFATTALVATASVAAADVTFSGYGRFGVMYTGSTAQTAANAAARAEAEARRLAVLEANMIAGAAATAGKITAAELDEAFSEIITDGASTSGELDYTALSKAATATDAFTTTSAALAYARAAKAAELARLNAYTAALKDIKAADVVAKKDALQFDPETGKVSVVDSTATAVATALNANSENVIDLNALASGASLTDDDIAAEVATLRVDTVGVVSDVATLDAVEEILPAVPDVDSAVSDMMITSRLRLNIDASAESDSGITFGARIRIQQGEGEIGTANAARFYAKTGGLEVGVGNIYGALESMPGQYAIDLGLTGLGYEYTVYTVGGADAYSSGGTGASGRNGVEVMYSVGDFAAHISASDADTAVATSSDRVAGTVAYTMNGWTAALGFQDSDTATDVEYTATLGGTIGGVSLGLGYAETNAGVDRTVMTVGMDVGAATNVEAYIADQSDRPDTGYGVDFNHSLGGGTSLRGGVASLTTGQTIADFGVRFNF